MSEESKQEEQKPLILEGDNIPEKFKGKPVEDVLKAYSEAEKSMHETKRQMSEINKKLQEYEEAKQQAMVDDEPEPDPYDYLTRSDMTKVLSDFEKKLEQKLSSITEQTSQSTQLEFEKREFLRKHKDFDEKDISALAAFGLQAGANTLDEAWDKWKGFAKKAGFSDKPEKMETPTAAGGSGNIYQYLHGQSESQEFDDQWVSRAKASDGKLSRFLK